MQAGEGESCLGGRARRGDHGHAPFACSHRSGLEQCGLPDPGLAAHDERAAALPDPVDQVVELSQLVVSAEKLGDSRLGAGASEVDLRLLSPETLPTAVAAPSCGREFSRPTQARPGTWAYRRPPGPIRSETLSQRSD